MEWEGTTNEGGYYSDIDTDDNKSRAGTSYINGINGINLSSLDVGASDSEALIDRRDDVIREVEDGDHKEHVGATEMHPVDLNNITNEAKDHMKKHKGKKQSETYIDFKDDGDYGNDLVPVFGSLGRDINNDSTLKIRESNVMKTPTTIPSEFSNNSFHTPKTNFFNKSHLYPTEDIEELSDTYEMTSLQMYPDTPVDATADGLDRSPVGRSDEPIGNTFSHLYSHPASKPQRSSLTYEGGRFLKDYKNINGVDSMNNNNKDNITSIHEVHDTNPMIEEAQEDGHSRSERQVETTTDNNSTPGGSVSHNGPVRYNGSILLDRDGDNEYPTRCIIKDRTQQRKSIFGNEILESFVPCVRKNTTRGRLWAVLSNEITILFLALIALITSVTKLTLTSQQLSITGLIMVTFLEVFAAISSLSLRTAEVWFKIDDEKEARNIELVMRKVRQKGKKALWIYTSGTSPELKRWKTKLVAIEATLGGVVILGFLICAVKDALLVTVLTTNIPLFIGDILGRMSIYHLNIGFLRIKQDHLKMALTESLYLLRDNAPSIKRKRFIDSVKASFYFPEYIDIPRLDQISLGKELGTKTETSFDTFDESAETSLMGLV